MTRSGKDPADKKECADARQPGMPSSHGDSPVGVTPMDVSPGDATARDITERPICSENAEVHQEAVLDESVELTFPASDPIAPSSITKIERSPARDKPSQK